MKAFLRYQGVTQAAALAFYALMSFIPVVFLGLAVAGEFYWGDPDQLQAFTDKMVEYVVPWVQELLHQRLLQLVQGSKGLGWMSLGFIVWTSGLFFAVLQSSMLLPWAREHDHKKGRWRYPLPWLVGPFMGFLLVGAMLLMHLGGYVSPDWLPFAVWPEFWTWLGLWILIFLTYRLFLPRKASIAATVLLSMLISGLSQVLTILFARIFLSLPNYSRVYGSLAGIVLFMLWLEYNMSLILWGGHYIRLWRERFGGPDNGADEPGLESDT
ncbi:MAG: YihY/virulence factor BrkB family protein, partial [Desulfovibrio sp.]